MISDLQQQLGIDATFFPQFLIFFLVFLWMRFVFFAPYLKLVEKRENLSQGKTDEAAKLEEESFKLEQDLAAALAAARKAASAERETILSGARKEASGFVEVARTKAKAAIEEARAANARAADSDLVTLKAQVAEVSGLLVEKLTKTKVGL